MSEKGQNREIGRELGKIGAKIGKIEVKRSKISKNWGIWVK